MSQLPPGARGSSVARAYGVLADMDEQYGFQEQIARRMDGERLARKTLGVCEDADGIAIKKAFRRLAMKYHPDRNAGNDQALRRFRKINKAYGFLNGNDDRIVFPEDGEPCGQRIGTYQDNEWGSFCHWKERFMDNFIGTGDEGPPNDGKQ